MTAYTFTYNSDTIPHLTAITNWINTGEAYTFTYSSASIASPISGQSFGTTTTLASAVVNTLNLTHSFTYNGSGELTKVVLPYGGYFAYDYTTTSYTNGRSYREVLKRHLSTDGTMNWQYSIAHETTPVYAVHQLTTIDDASLTGEKYWAFAATGQAQGLVTQYQGRQMPGPVALTQNDFSWATDGVGNNYIATSLTTLNPGSSQAQKKTTQTVDNYGNVLQVQNYDYNSLTTPMRTYTYTYLHTNSSTYTSLYILNRMIGASVTDGTTNVTLATTIYDLYNYGGAYACSAFPQLASASPSWGWDANFSSTNVTARGNAVQVATPSGTTCIAYDVTGNPVSTTANGVKTQVTSSTGNNLAVPSQLSVGSLTTNLTWSSFLGLTNESGPNGDSSSTVYDQYARPTNNTSPFGATTSISYSTPPYNSLNLPTITSAINGRKTIKTMDGVGHTILTATGDANGIKGQAESVYQPCACSPMGKLTQQAMPHVVGGTPVWTTYTYDGIGRTLSVVSPDGYSTTNYLYQGNTVRVTDPAGNWKIFTMDGLGNLTQVTEPNPGSNQ